MGLIWILLLVIVVVAIGFMIQSYSAPMSYIGSAEEMRARVLSVENLKVNDDNALDALGQGKKTIEIRPKKPYTEYKLHKNAPVSFSNERKLVVAQLVDKVEYPSLSALLDSEKPEKISASGKGATKNDVKAEIERYNASSIDGPFYALHVKPLYTYSP